MNIGIYGGSFDPIHFGHINLAIQLKEYHHLDEVWFCPAYSSPFKLSHTTESATHRLNMVALAIETIPGFSVTDIEILREGPSYTIDTVRSFHKHYLGSNKKFFLMIGNDALSSLHLWKEIDELIELAPLLIGNRILSAPSFSGTPALQRAIKKGITPSSIMEISASFIRKRLKNFQYCAHLVPAKVLDYIYKNQLYSIEHES
ncbi:MAG: nicotinate (nicotinamide) nucleotide adenylyltransferase [Chlamydiales bacterium]|nr:nicotinate (nicotinamide) nucleotide adenylyltransferase [Chlamydiales bacterium]